MKFLKAILCLLVSSIPVYLYDPMGMLGLLICCVPVGMVWLLAFLPLLFFTRRFEVWGWPKAGLLGGLLGTALVLLFWSVSGIAIYGLSTALLFALGTAISRKRWALKKPSRRALWITALACGLLAALLLWTWHRQSSPPKIRLLTNPRREVVLGEAIPIDKVGISAEWLPDPNANAADTTERVVLEFHLESTSCAIVPISGGYDYLKVANLEPFSGYHEPMLPMQTYRVELNRDTRLLRAKVTEGVFHEVVGEVNIGSIRPHEPNQLRIRDPDVFFPGRLVQCEDGLARGKRIVYVRFFPVQYLPRKRQVRLVTSALIVLECGRDAGKAPSSTPVATPGGSATLPSVILCPAALAEPARRLAEFHEREDRLPTAVVTTEFIKEHYAEAPYPPLLGIGSPTYQGSKGVLAHYDASLAEDRCLPEGRRSSSGSGVCHPAGQRLARPAKLLRLRERQVAGNVLRSLDSHRLLLRVARPRLGSGFCGRPVAGQEPVGSRSDGDEDHHLAQPDRLELVCQRGDCRGRE